MRTTHPSPDEDDENKKGNIPTAGGNPPNQDTPANSLDPIRNAQRKTAGAGFLLAQLVRGSAGGVARALVESFLNDN